MPGAEPTYGSEREVVTMIGLVADTVREKLNGATLHRVELTRTGDRSTRGVVMWRRVRADLEDETEWGVHGVATFTVDGETEVDLVSGDYFLGPHAPDNAVKAYEERRRFW